MNIQNSFNDLMLCLRALRGLRLQVTEKIFLIIMQSPDLTTMRFARYSDNSSLSRHIDSSSPKVMQRWNYAEFSASNPIRHLEPKLDPNRARSLSIGQVCTVTVLTS